MPTLRELLHDPRWRPLWRGLLAVGVAVTSWFAFTPAPPTLDFAQSDKVQHLLAFGSLAGASVLAFAGGWRRDAAAAAALLLYGGFIEIVQSFLPTRHGDWADLAADACGIALGMAVLALLRRRFRAGPD